MSRNCILTVAALAAIVNLSYANSPRGGTDREKQALHEAVIGAKANLYGDEIPIAATPRMIGRASKELLELGDETLYGYEATFFVFPQEGKPIIAPGALLPAGEAISDIPNAIMHMRTDAKTMVRLNELPPSTIVYGVDVTGNKAWYPLELFTAHSVYPGFISADGFYAYTYRPSAKLYGRYGETAYYLDILHPARLHEALLGLEDNITLLGAQLPDNTARVAWYVRSAFFAPLVTRFRDLDMLRNIQFEITVFADRNIIDVRIPYGIEYENGTDGIRIYPFSSLFDGLGEYREAIAGQLQAEGHDGEAVSVRNMKLAVTHFNTTGNLTLIKKEPSDTVFTVIAGDLEDGFTARADEPIGPGTELFAYLARHIESSGRERRDSTDTLSNVTDWKSLYDTDTERLSRTAGQRRVRNAADDVAAYRPYELDVQPSFRGGGFESFEEWLHSEVWLPESGDRFMDSALVDFIVDERGEVIYIREVESTWPGLINAVYIAMTSSLGDWSPGEVAGIPVKTRYRFLFTK